MRNYKRQQDSIELSDEQKVMIDKHWDKWDLKILTQKVFNDETLNGHSGHAKKIKSYLVDTFGDSVKVRTTSTNLPEKPAEIELSESEKEFLNNNGDSVRVEEATKILFPGKFSKKKIEFNDPEYKAVYKYIKGLNSNNIPKEDQIVDEGEYRPPGSIARMVPRVNLYVTKGVTEENKRFLDPMNLKPQEKKLVEALIGYCATHRFVMLMSEYKKRVDRDLAESSYIRWLYGKDDLLEEEVDRYISLVEEIVDSSKIRRAIERLDKEANEMMDGSNPEGKKIGMTMVEMMNSQRDKLKLSKERGEKLLSNLVDSRADRMKKKQEKTASLLNIVEIWKQEESRKKILALAARRRLLLSAEVERLSSMESLKSEIYGLDKDDIVN